MLIIHQLLSYLYAKKFESVYSKSYCFKTFILSNKTLNRTKNTCILLHAFGCVIINPKFRYTIGMGMTKRVWRCQPIVSAVFLINHQLKSLCTGVGKYPVSIETSQSKTHCFNFYHLIEGWFIFYCEFFSFNTFTFH